MLLIFCLLRLFLRLLLHFLQLFDLLFQGLGFPAISQKNGLVFRNAGMVFGFTHGFPVHLLRLVHHFQRSIDLFPSLVKILLLKCLKRSAEFGAGSGMRNHAEILRDLAADFRVVDTVGESAFILFDRLGQLSLRLGIDSAIKEFDRIIGPGFRRGLPGGLILLRINGCRCLNGRRIRTIHRILPVFRNSLRMSRQSGEEENHRGCRRCAVADSPLGKSKPDQHQQECDSKRISETVNRFCGFNALIILRSESANTFFQSVQARIPGSRADIDSCPEHPSRF